MPLNTPQWLSLAVSVLLFMFASGWLYASRFDRERARGMRLCALFNVCTGVGIAMVGLRSALPQWTHGVSNVAVMLGFMIVVRAVVSVLDLDPLSVASYDRYGSLGLVAVVVLSFLPVQSTYRVAALFLAVGLISCRGSIEAAGKLRARGLGALAWMILVAGGSFGAALLARAASGVLFGSSIEVDLDRPGSLGVVFAALIGGLLLNLVLILGIHDLSIRKLEKLAGSDGLTQLPNRRHFEEQLEREWRRAQRSGEPFTVILCDIDEFKAVNDAYGHDAGDRLLQEVAVRLGAAVRREDLVARYGGDEFAVLLPGADQDLAAAIAERIRAGIAEASFSLLPEVEAHVTVSLGVAARDSETRDPDVLVVQADRALYRSKRRGRNLVSGDGGPRSAS